MGCWGPYLFQSDDDYDVMGELDDAAGVTLYFFGNDTNGPEAARNALDNGKFEELWAKVKSKVYERTILVALAMKVGAKIDEEKRKLVKRSYKKSRFMEGSIEQLNDALKGYQNGQPWDFENSVGLLDTMMNSVAGASGPAGPTSAVGGGDSSEPEPGKDGKSKEGDGPVSSTSAIQAAPGGSKVRARDEDDATDDRPTKVSKTGKKSSGGKKNKQSQASAEM